MPTPNELLDQYVIETIVQDQSDAALQQVQKNLSKTQQVAQQTAAALKGTGDATGTLASGVEKAISTLDRMANKGDAVTQAYNRLQKAQSDLAAAQQAANRAIEAGEEDLGKIERTLASFAQKVDAAAQKLGEQRAIAQANEAATSAWTGAIGEGSQAISAYANSIAKTTEAASALQVSMAQLAGGQAELNRILGTNASGANFAQALQRARAEIDPLYDASMRYASALEKIDNYETLGIVNSTTAEFARRRLNDAYAEAVQPMSMVNAEQQKAKDLAEQVYLAMEKQAQAIQTAAEAQAYYSQAGAQGSLRSSQQIQMVDAGPAQQSAEAMSAAIDQLGAKYNTVNSIMDQYAQRVEETNLLVANGDLTLAERAEILDTMSGKTAEAVAQFEAMASAQDKLSRAARQEAADMDAIRSKIDPVYRLSQEYAKSLSELNLALDTNAISEIRHGQLLNDLNTGYMKAQEQINKMKESSNAAAYAARFLGIQFSQAISGIATGQDVFTVILQQGHQMLDVFLAMGGRVGQLGEVFKAVFAGIGGWPTVAVLAFAAAIYELTKAGNDSIGTMNRLKVELKGNHDDYVQMAQDVVDVARKVSNSTRLTLDEATAGAETIAKNKYFAGTAQDLENLSRLAINLGAAMGKDASEGFKTLSDAMTDPLKVANELSSTFGTTLNANFLRDLETTSGLENQFRKLTDALKSIGDAGKDSLSPIRDAWVNLGNAFTSSTNGWKPLEEWLANTFAGTLNIIASAVRGIADAWNSIPDAISGAVSAMKSIWTFFGKTPAQTAAEAINQTTSATTEQLQSTIDRLRTNQENGIQQNIVGVADSSGLEPVGAAYYLPKFNQFQKDVTDQITSILQTEFHANESQIVGFLAGGPFRENPSLDPSKQIIDSNGLPSGGLMMWNGPRLTGPNGLLAANNATSLSQVDVPSQVRFAMQEIFSNQNLTTMWKDMGDTFGANAAAIWVRDFERPKNASRDMQTSAWMANTILGESNAITTPMVNENRRLLDDAAKSASGTPLNDLTNLTKQWDDLQKQMAVVAATSGTDSQQFLELQQRSDNLAAAIYNSKTALEKRQEQFESDRRASEGATEGTRAYNAAIEQARQAALNAKGVFTFADEAQATSNFLAQQNQQLRNLTGSMDLVIVKNTNLASSYQMGDQAIIDQTSKQQALEQLMRMFPGDAAKQSAALAGLAEKYKEVAGSAVQLQEAQTIRNQERQIEFIKGETDSIGMGVVARQQYLDVLKATIDARARDGNELSDESKKIIENTKAIDEQKSAYQRLQASFNEISSTFDTVFSDVENVVTSAFAMGSDHALRFKDVVTSVVNDLEKEFFKLSLTNPLKNFLLGTNSPDIFSTAGVLGSLLGFSSGGSETSAASTVAGVGSLAALFGLGGKGSSSSSTSPFDQAGTTLNADGSLAAPANSSSNSGTGILSTGLGVGSLALKLGDVFSNGIGGTAVNLLSSSMVAPITNAIAGFFGGSSATGVDALQSLGLFRPLSSLSSSQLAASNNVGSAVDSISGAGKTAFGTINDLLNTTLYSSTAGQAGATASGATLDSATGAVQAGGIGVTAGQALGAIGGLYSAYSGFQRGGVGGTVQGVAGLAGAGLAVAGTGLLGAGAAGLAAAAGPYAPIALAAIAIIGALLPGAHPIHPFQGTEVNVDNGQLSVGRTLSQAEDPTATMAGTSSWVGAVNDYMAATKIVATNQGRIGAVGEGVQGFPMTLNPNDLFKALRFTNDPSDISTFGTAKQGGLSGMQFNSIDELQATLVKFATFADNLDILGIKLQSVGTNLTNIQISGLENPNQNDLRKALNTDLPRQTFANVDALNAEIDKVNTFINQTVPGLLQPVRQTTSAVIDSVSKVNQTYTDAINQAASYGLDYTNELRNAEQKAIDIVRHDAEASITNNAIALHDAAESAFGGQQNSFKGVMDNWYIQAQATLDSIDKAFRETYGDMIISTQGYVDAMAKASDDLEKQKRLVEFQAQNAADTATDTIQQTLAQIKARGLVASGNPNQAAVINFDAQSKLEVDQLKKALVEYYGAAYASTQDYLDQINNLEAVQGQERVALVNKQLDEINANINHQTEKANYASSQTNFQTAQNALVTAINKQISSTNSQISAIQANNTALHATADSLRSFVTGLRTSQASPLTPMQQLQAAQTAYNTAVSKLNAPGLTATQRSGLTGNVTSAASTLLDKASSFFAPASKQYTDIFKAIDDGLSSSADYYDSQTTVSDKQLAVLNQQLDIQQNQLTQIQSLGQTADDLADLEQQMLGAFNVMRDYLKQLNAVAPTAQTLAAATAYALQAVVYGHGLAGEPGGPVVTQGAAPISYESVLSGQRAVDSNVIDYLMSGGTLGGPTPLNVSNLTEGHAAGGFVSNGTWNRDSVRSGHSRLAGGEYVVTAMEAARFADILPSINSGTYDPNGNKQLLGEVRGLNDKLRQLIDQIQKGNTITAQGSLAVVQAVSGDQYQKNVDQSRNKIARVRGLSS